MYSPHSAARRIFNLPSCNVEQTQGKLNCAGDAWLHAAAPGGALEPDGDFYLQACQLKAGITDGDHFKVA